MKAAGIEGMAVCMNAENKKMHLRRLQALARIWNFVYHIYTVNFCLWRCDVNGFRGHFSVRETTCRWVVRQ